MSSNTVAFQAYSALVFKRNKLEFLCVEVVFLSGKQECLLYFRPLFQSPLFLTVLMLLT